MRHEFYGDRKDVLKWTYALRAAGQDKDVLYVAMLRPNKNQHHGWDFKEVDGVDPIVKGFFTKERLAFELPSCRSIRRVSALSPRIEVVDDLFTHRSRHMYFRTIIDHLKRRAVGRPYVVLLDPDNGVGGKCPKGEHLCSHEISSVWSAMTPGDVLMVYQHQFRDKEWISKTKSKIEEVIGHTQITCLKHPDVLSVCFFQLVKTSMEFEAS